MRPQANEIFFNLKRQEFTYNYDSKMDYNEVLLIIGLGAIYLFEFYSIIAVLNCLKKSTEDKEFDVPG